MISLQRMAFERIFLNKQLYNLIFSDPSWLSSFIVCFHCNIKFKRFDVDCRSFFVIINLFNNGSIKLLFLSWFSRWKQVWTVSCLLPPQGEFLVVWKVLVMNNKLGVCTCVVSTFYFTIIYWIWPLKTSLDCPIL